MKSPIFATLAVMAFIFAIAFSPPGNVTAATSVKAEAVVTQADKSPSYIVLAAVQALELIEQAKISPTREFSFSNGNRATADFVRRQLQDAIIQTYSKERESYTYPYYESPPVVLEPVSLVSDCPSEMSAGRRAREHL
jgi:hypothetical protein